MKGCPVCYVTWGDEVLICNSVNSKTRKICGGKLK